MITAYLAERFRPVLFVPFAIALTIAASAGRYHAPALLFDAVTMILLLLQFRLWDDLADRSSDVLRHPERVLVRAPSVDPFVRLCAVLAFVNIALSAARDDSGIALLALGALIAALGAWYVRRSRRSLPGDQLLLAKYPAFVVIVAGARLLDAPLLIALSCAAVYLAASAYEAWHDPASPVREIRGRAALDTGTARAPRPVPALEHVACYLCGSSAATEFIQAEDDLGGTPGRFRFVRCLACGLVYQNPRVTLAAIGAYYDDTYIAHRKKRNWGVLTPLFERAMDKLDIDKTRIVSRYVSLNAGSEALDVGCAVGTFLSHLRQTSGARVTGVDFKDLSSAATLREVEFHCGLFYEADLSGHRFDLVTMWHFLEHDYDPIRSLRTAHRVLKPQGTLVVEVPRLDSRTFRWFGSRWPGLQAPQHTVLYDRQTLVRAVTSSGFEVVDYLPYGAFPAYFYLFTGAAFRVLRGRGLDLDQAIVPYFIGQLLALPVMLFEKRLNLAMQTVVCRKAA
jgi:SAM-dependent methyltransferase